MRPASARFFFLNQRSLLFSLPLFMIVTILWTSVTAMAAPVLTLSPSSITWDTNIWVSFDLNGIASGSAVNLQLYVDVDRNSLVGTNDILLTQFGLTDGVGNSLGSDNIVCDTNGVVDGRVQGKVSYHGLADMAQFWHATGSYLWRAAYTNGSVITFSVFTVTQPAGSVSIVGSVNILTNISSMTGKSSPGALVIPEMFSSLQGVMPATWTDTNGNFILYLPVGMSTQNLSGFTALKPDYFTVDTAGGGEPLSTRRLTAPLTNGVNMLSGPLFILPALPDILTTVSGTVMDDSSNVLAGVLLMIQPEDDNGGMSFGISKTNGMYAIPWPSDMGNGLVMSMSPLLNMRGFMGSGVSFMSSTSNLSGLDLVCPAATTLARVLVKNSEGAGGVIGAKVNIFGDMTGAESFSFNTNGLCELCIIDAANGSAEISNESLQSYRRVCLMDEFIGLTFSGSGVYSSVNFTTYPGQVLSGHVYDSIMNPLPGGYVYARATNQNDALDSQAPNFGGLYELLLSAGTYEVGTWEYNQLGYPDQTFSNHITVSSQPVANIDFILTQNAVISGRVMGGGNPLEFAHVEAEIVTFFDGGGWNSDGVAGAETDASGYYTLMVPPGTSYVVRARGPNGSVWLEQFYSNAVDVWSAEFVTPAIDEPATNINFDLQPGALISGRVLGEGNPLEFVEISADIITFEPGGGWSSYGVAWTDTDVDGYYQLVLPPGTSYAVRAQAPYGTLWLEQYYSNTMDAASASLVFAAADEPTTNIDFNLQAGAVISGRVLGDGQPLEGASVQVGTVTFEEGGGWNWNQSYYGPSTDSNGEYIRMVPPGTNYYVAVYPPLGTTWLSQFYSNATDIAQAQAVAALTNAPATNINFNLQAGAVISGRVLGDGQPLEGASVQVGTVTFEEGGGWNWNQSYYGPSTDLNGEYIRVVPPGTNYYVEVYPPFGTIWMSQFYSNATDISQAQAISTFTNAPATNINFYLSHSALQVDTTSLPNGTNGVFYSVQLMASGGQPPYNWYLPGGSISLPMGMNLSGDGLLYGTPANNGTVNFQVAVYVTSPYEEATQWLSLTIVPEEEATELKWSLPLNGGPIYFSSPAISTGGVIYVGSGAFFNYTPVRGLYAINRGGTQIWEYTSTNMNQMFTPAVDTNGVIYVQDVTSSLFALNPNGTLKWKYPLNRYIEVGQSAPAIADDGTIYVCAESVYAINPDGTLKWKNLQLGMSTIRNSPAIALNGTVYAGVNEVGGGLVALNPGNGSIQWYCTLQGTEWVFSSPAIGYDGTIYIGSENSGSTNYIFAVTNGAIKWRYEVLGGRAIRSSPAIGVDGTIYIGTKAGATTNAELLALNPNGALKWSYAIDQAGADIYSSPAVGADGIIYVGAETGYLYALNPDGTLAWKYYTGNGINWSSPAIDTDGVVYIGNNDGKLFAIPSSSMGLAESSWPKFRHDSRNTGNWKTINPEGRPALWVYLAGTNNITVAWPSPSVGFTLQQNYILGTTNWNAPAEFINDNGTSKFILVNSPTGSCFYRLMYP